MGEFFFISPKSTNSLKGFPSRMGRVLQIIPSWQYLTGTLFGFPRKHVAFRGLPKIGQKLRMSVAGKNRGWGRGLDRGARCVVFPILGLEALGGQKLFAWNEVGRASAAFLACTGGFRLRFVKIAGSLQSFWEARGVTNSPPPTIQGTRNFLISTRNE